MGVGVELLEGVCQFRLQGNGGPGHRVPKPELEGEHSGVLCVQRLFSTCG